MKRLSVLIFGLSLIILLLFGHSAQTQTWKDLVDQADSLSEADNADSAIVMAKAALEKVEAQFGKSDTTVASVLNSLGKLYRKQAKYTDAEPLLKRALEIWEKALGLYDPHVALSLNNLGNLYYYDQGRYAEAEPLYRRALEIREKTLGPDHPDVAGSLNNLGNLYGNQGRHGEAESLYKRALEIREKTLGPDHPLVVSSLNNLGVLYWKQGRYAEAEPLWKRTLEIREKTLGPDHPRVARSLNNLGYLYMSQGRYAEAEPFIKRTLEIFEKALGPDHLNVAFSLNNLGNLYHYLGRYAETERLYKRALRIKEKALGPDHPEVATSLDNLGVLCSHQGRYAEAEPILKRALEIREKTLGPDHPDVAGSLNNLGNLYRDQGRYTEAGLLYKLALKVREKALGPEHPDVASSLTNLGNLYSDQGRYAEAEPLYKRALRIKEKALGPDHPGVALTLTSLGNLYSDQGRYAEAEPLYKRALKIQEKTLGPDHPSWALSLNNLGNLYSDQGRYAEAELCLKRALEIWEKILGPDHPWVAYNLTSLGNLYSNQGRYTEADSPYRQALEILEETLGPDHPNVAECLSGLGTLCRDQGRRRDSRSSARRAYDIRRKNFRDGFEVLSEKNALLYSKFMRDEAGTYLSILCDSPDTSSNCAREIADVVFSSKGQVSDGIFARQRTFLQETDSSLKALADSLRLARFKLANLWVKGPDEEHPEGYKNELAKTSAEKEKLESELARKSVSFRRELEIWEVNSRKVSQCLPTGSALVEYMKYSYRKPRGEAESHYLAVVVKSENDVFTVDLGRAAKIDSSVSWYRSHFQFPSMINEKDYKRISDEIYQLVWKPIENELGQPEIVFIAPDGALNLVSFAGLMDDTGKYLTEKFPIHYLSSGRDLLRLKEKPPSGSGLLALGDPDYDAPASARLSTRPVQAAADTLLASVFPIVRNVRSGCKELREIKVSRLPQTRQEVELISKRWKEESKEPVRVYFGAQACEETFKADAPGSKVIHLATHGYFVSPEYLQRPQRRSIDPLETFVGENPLLHSGLFLAGSNLHGKGADSLGCEDGILTAEEVAGMDLEGTELVVLSACETGLGEVKLGEGVYGLRRAFQMAGVRTVISALWPVSDQTTAELMGRLYSPKKGNIPQLMQRMALNQIKELRKKGQSDHPYSWGAFIALAQLSLFEKIFLVFQ